MAPTAAKSKLNQSLIRRLSIEYNNSHTIQAGVGLRYQNDENHQEEPRLTVAVTQSQFPTKQSRLPDHESQVVAFVSQPGYPELLRHVLTNAPLDQMHDSHSGDLSYST